MALTGGMFASGHTKPRLGIDLAGGTSITLQAKSQPGEKNAVNKTNMNTAVDIIERRVNGLGVSEAEVQTQGNDNIVVNIPKGSNEKQAREQVGTTAQLFFRPVLTLAPGAPQKEQPPADPSKSPDKGGDKDKGQGEDKDAAEPDDKATGGAGDKASPSPTATTQGRPLSEGLTADDPTPTASPSGKPSDKESTPPKPSGEEAKAADLQKRFMALDCTKRATRAKTAEQSAAAKGKDVVLGCGQNNQKQWQKYILGPVGVQGRDVDDAKAVLDTTSGAGWKVTMDFNGKGAKAFGDITGELAKKQSPQNQFAIVLDGEVVSDPYVSRALTQGTAEISGSFDQQSAKDLANILSYGALPLSFREDTVTTVTAALGGEQLRAGLIAGAIGLALVVIYLVAYYRGLSLIAIASLLVSAALTYTIMALLGPTIGFALNLPAVCGAIVAIGITADSFIVFFERIRDEIREGRSLRPAVERGWPRARRTILVSDFVSFLAAAVLFIVTVGKVQGFAFTLGLTTLLDVVVVFLFTKPLMTILARKKFFANGHPWSGLDPKRLGAKPPLRRTRRTHSSDTKEA
ncbi:export membrane protein secD [Streptomyces albus]|uniref:Protein translocase subunit SecD n=1 Tax=Streptomyces albus (strain ATCC 21838 / DSM 41398 / FERM P-419 / JCM 4703 / NBRC 107858) TaxID=1081613 RepID=A0A0B5F5G4_STRA4|nr:export membrane protein secD [Streptomyces albus]AOU81099.1 export membrane protein secD [Streptomyces albus]